MCIIEKSTFILSSSSLQDVVNKQGSVENISFFFLMASQKKDNSAFKFMIPFTFRNKSTRTTSQTKQ